MRWIDATPRQRAMVYRRLLEGRDFAAELREIERQAEEVKASGRRPVSIEIELRALRSEYRGVQAAQRQLAEIHRRYGRKK